MKLPPQQNGVESNEPTCPDHGQFVLVPPHPTLGHPEEGSGFGDRQETVRYRWAVARILIRIDRLAVE